MVKNFLDNKYFLATVVILVVFLLNSFTGMFSLLSTPGLSSSSKSWFTNQELKSYEDARSSYSKTIGIIKKSECSDNIGLLPSYESPFGDTKNYVSTWDKGISSLESLDGSSQEFDEEVQDIVEQLNQQTGDVGDAVEIFSNYGCWDEMSSKEQNAYGNIGVLVNTMEGIGFRTVAERVRKGVKPDSDGDSVIDFNDVCPSVSGSELLNGCPDKDGDGVSDSSDVMPGEPGSKNDGSPTRFENIVHLFGDLTGLDYYQAWLKGDPLFSI